MYNRHRSDEGQVVLVTVASVVSLILLMALVVDLGVVYLRKIQLSNAADAAALAGVQALPEDPTKALALSTEYADSNGIDGQFTALAVSKDMCGVDVRIGYKQPMLFARLAGIDFADLEIEASAKVNPIYKVFGARPLGIVDKDFIHGKAYMLKFGAGIASDPSGFFEHGNYGALALGNNGASNYQDNIEEGYLGWLEVGQEIDTEPGNMSGPTRKGIQNLLKQCPHTPQCTFANRRDDCPRHIVVPIVNSDADLSGRSPLSVTGFAYFFLEDLSGSGQDAFIIGRFVKKAMDFPGSNAAKDYGLRSYALIK